MAHSIGIQEGLGLDILVHGEMERTDMVWVQISSFTIFADRTCIPRRLNISAVSCMELLLHPTDGSNRTVRAV